MACWESKVGCVFPMVVISILPHAEIEPNDHREDAPTLQGKGVWEVIVYVGLAHSDGVFQKCTNVRHGHTFS